MKNYFKLILLLVVVFISTTVFATICKGTINCQTSGYKVLHYFYYADGRQGIAACNPTSSGKNNCTFYNTQDECPARGGDPIAFFKNTVAPNESGNVKKC